jgi:hypothetical protein
MKRIIADENAPRGLVVYLNGEHSVKYIVCDHCPWRTGMVQN